jgi:hypothetical protein
VNHAIAAISKRISTHSRQRVVKSMQRCAVAKYTKPKNTSKKVNFAKEVQRKYVLVVSYHFKFIVSGAKVADRQRVQLKSARWSLIFVTS